MPQKAWQNWWIVKRLIVASSLILLTACASKGPEVPPEPLQPIAKITLLPVVGHGQSSSPEYMAEYKEHEERIVYQPMPSFVKGSPTAGIGAGLVGLGVAAIIANQAEKSQLALEKVTSSINFQPAELLNRRIKEKFEAKGINIEPVEDMNVSTAVRYQEDYASLPSKTEAVLDIRVNESGYFKSIRAGGYSPMLGITALLVSPESGEELASFSYWSDWRESKEDPRWFTSPSSTIFSTLEELEANAASVREALEVTVEKIAEKIVDDVRRRSLGEHVE